MSDQSGFQILADMPADVIAVRASGKIQHHDYSETLVPLVTRKIAALGKVKLLYILGDDFESVSLAAAWDDARLGLLHLGDFAQIAVVSDIGWIKSGVRLFAPLIRCPVQVFGMAELDAAKAWVTQAV